MQAVQDAHSSPGKILRAGAGIGDGKLQDHVRAS